MKRKRCEFKITNSAPNNYISKFLGIKLYERKVSMMKELLIFGKYDSNIPISTVSLSILSGNKVPEWAFLEGDKWDKFVEDIIFYELASMIIGNEITFFKVIGSYKYINGLVSSSLVDYILELKNAKINEPNWVKQGIIYALKQGTNLHLNKSNIKAIIGNMINYYLGNNKEHNNPHRQFVLNMLSKEAVNHDWIVLKQNKPKYKIRLRSEYLLLIEDAKLEELTSFRIAKEIEINDILSSEKELLLFKNDVSNIISNEMSNRVVR